MVSRGALQIPLLAIGFAANAYAGWQDAPGYGVATDASDYYTGPGFFFGILHELLGAPVGRLIENTGGDLFERGQAFRTDVATIVNSYTTEIPWSVENTFSDFSNRLFTLLPFAAYTLPKSRNFHFKLYEGWHGANAVTVACSTIAPYMAAYHYVNLTSVF